MKITKAIVTGASGFIGSHLVGRLLKDGVEVHALIRSNSARDKIADLFDDTGNLQIHVADISSFCSLSKVIEQVKPKTIFHLAAYTKVGRSPENIELANGTNLQGTINLLRALENIDYDCFINTGTCEEYGHNPAPFREDQQVDPISPYSASKSAAWLFCNLYHNTYGHPILTLRPFTTYGPRQSENMLISQLILSALRGEDFKTSLGKQTREFNYVGDIVYGYIKAATSPEAIGETINLGTGVEYQIRDVVIRTLDLMGNPIKPLFGALPYREHEIWHLYCDNTKAKKILGWEPKVSLEEGLTKTIKWHKIGEW